MSTYESPIPGASIYTQQKLGINTAYDKAKIALQNKRGTYLRQAGYQMGPDGKISVDPTDVYGGYQQMLQGQAQGLEQNDDAQAGRGFADNAGLGGQAEHQLQYQQGTQQQGFANDVQGTLAGFDSERQGLDSNYNNDLYNVDLDAARNATGDPNNFNAGDHRDVNVPYGEGPTPGPPGVANRLLWGGKSLNKNGMLAWLAQHGQSPRQWAQMHPAAAKTLGL